MQTHSKVQRVNYSGPYNTYCMSVTVIYAERTTNSVTVLCEDNTVDKRAHTCPLL